VQIFEYGLRLIVLIVSVRGGLRPKILHGNMIYKSHKEIAKKASHRTERASILPKMYLKSLATLSLKASHLKIHKEKPSSLWKCLQKASLSL
jgi:hypothetical protein